MLRILIVTYFYRLKGALQYNLINPWRNDLIEETAFCSMHWLLKYTYKYLALGSESDTLLTSNKGRQEDCCGSCQVANMQYCLSARHKMPQQCSGLTYNLLFQESHKPAHMKPRQKYNHIKKHIKFMQVLQCHLTAIVQIDQCFTEYPLQMPKRPNIRTLLRRELA